MPSWGWGIYIRMSRIHRLIETMRTRPGMYLADCGISGLCNFLNGYAMAADEDGRGEEELLPLPFWFFHEFAAYKFGYAESTSGWRNMLLDQTGGDERQALNAFFPLYDEFKAIRAEKCCRTVLESENLCIPARSGGKGRDSLLSCVNQKGEVKPLYTNALKCYRIRLAIPDAAYLILVETVDMCIMVRELYRTRQDADDYVRDCFGPTDEWVESEYKDGKIVGLSHRIYLE